MLTKIETEKLRYLCEQNVRIKIVMKEKLDFRLLLEKVIKTGNLNLENLFGQSCLLYASEYNLPGLARFFLDHGANINITSNLGIKPIHYAIMHSKVEMVKLLIEYGAFLDISTIDKDVIKMLAKKCNNKEIIDLLENTEQIRQDFLNKTEEITLEQQIESDKDKTPEEILREARENFARILK